VVYQPEIFCTDTLRNTIIVTNINDKHANSQTKPENFQETLQISSRFPGFPWLLDTLNNPVFVPLYVSGWNARQSRWWCCPGGRTVVGWESRLLRHLTSADTAVMVSHHQSASAACRSVVSPLHIQHHLIICHLDTSVHNTPVTEPQITTIHAFSLLVS